MTAVGVGDEGVIVCDVPAVEGIVLLLTMELTLLLVDPVFGRWEVDEENAGAVEFGAEFAVSDSLLAFTRLKTSEYTAEFSR